MDINLINRANPALLSRVEEYPFNYDELLQYLTVVPCDHNTHLSYPRRVDYQIYKKNEDYEDIDIEKKLAYEYMLYRVSANSNDERKQKQLTELMELQDGSSSWYKEAVKVLHDIVESTEAVTVGDGVRHEEKSNIEMVKNQPVENDKRDDSELQVAFNDLQLAHSFLTKQFENDRIKYMKDIEMLNNKNKELMEKLQQGKVEIADEKEEEPEERVKVKRVDADVLDNISSVSIMRKEFKKMVHDMRQNYEEKLATERRKLQNLEIRLK